MSQTDKVFALENVSPTLEISQFDARDWDKCRHLKSYLIAQLINN